MWVSMNSLKLIDDLTKTLGFAKVHSSKPYLFRNERKEESTWGERGGHGCMA